MALANLTSQFPSSTVWFLVIIAATMVWEGLVAAMGLMLKPVAVPRRSVEEKGRIVCAMKAAKGFYHCASTGDKMMIKRTSILRRLKVSSCCPT